MIIAIDGPAGAGKSTVARRLADALGFVLLDTGALYRAVALAAARGKVSVNDAERSGALAEDLARRGAIVLERAIGAAGTDIRVVLDGEDVSRAIRTPEIGMDASTVSAHAAVRKALLDMQRRAGEGNVVAEGRDMGTVVFPNAEHKFFLTASVEVRAQRRFEELTEKGRKVTLAETLEEVQRRDAQDTGRAVAPLRPAPDAVQLDSSSKPIDEVLKTMLERVRRAR